ncbi:helix-turn-helix domain-containing protein [Halomicrobium urmianum]|uniref:helix-turn-helix domain-containing protein n=1 Tax=Halomicrobium urmianum TaxID=1586233 RepID=UPI001CD9C399|nr:bacterio-opsin activator domain-containing protein [Halomicrobium urmianum]
MDTEERASTVELTFEVRDDRSFFVAASEALSCRVVGEEAIHRRDGDYLEYLTVEAPADETLTFARSWSGAEHARVVRADDGECILELVLDGAGCVVGTLANTHALVSEAYAEDGVGIVVAEAPEHADARAIVEELRDHHEATSLLSKRHRDEAGLSPVTSRSGAERYLSKLTTKQRDAVRAAVRCGYLAWPRRSTASECAEALGVSQPTFSQHLYRGLEILLTALFEEVADETDQVPAEP